MFNIGMNFLTLRKARHHSSPHALSGNYHTNKMLSPYIKSSSSISHLENIVAITTQQTNHLNQNAFFIIKKDSCTNSK